MNKIIQIGVALTILTLSFNISAAQNNEKEKFSIYYSNGMFNTYNEAWESYIELIGRIPANPSIDTKFALSYNQKEFSVDEIVKILEFSGYDITADIVDALGTIPTSIAQAAEVIWQFFGDRATEPAEILDQITLSSNKPSQEWLINFFNSYSRKITEQHYDGDADLQQHIDKYKEDLKDDRKIIIISHSQGNYYANNAFNYLKQENEMNANCMSVIAVATPASHTVGGGSYITRTDDQIIKMIPGALPGTYFNYSDGGDENNHHNFSLAYLQGDITGSAIINKIQLSIEKLKDSCGFRITEIVGNNLVVPYYEHKYSNIEIHWEGDVKLPLKAYVSLNECDSDTYCYNSENWVFGTMNDEMNPFLHPYACGIPNNPYTYVGKYTSRFEIYLEDANGLRTRPEKFNLTCNVIYDGIVLGSWHPTPVLVY